MTMKRVTYRITATLHGSEDTGEVDKAYAKSAMELALSRYPFDTSDPFIQVMQIDPINDTQEEKSQ